ncbi:MAG: hypothetical protein A4S14_01630 [Proteobacteria bacterium SG_bin9]|nr:MAG: hypothetical protein A4S14_01630 [Proteobacteria bacterium SG_bin9]
MKTIVIATATVMSFGSLAWAQGSAGTTSGGTAAGSTTVIQAPVGHRQPKRSDVPDVSADQARNDAADRELDRKIRSICRGC